MRRELLINCQDIFFVFCDNWTFFCSLHDAIALSENYFRRTFGIEDIFVIFSDNNRHHFSFTTEWNFHDSFCSMRLLCLARNDDAGFGSTDDKCSFRRISEHFAVIDFCVIAVQSSFKHWSERKLRDVFSFISKFASSVITGP